MRTSILEWTIGRVSECSHEFQNRSDTLIELLEELTQEGHEYVLPKTLIRQR